MTAALALMLAVVLLLAPTATAKPQRGAYWGAWIGPQLTGSQPPWDMSAVSRFEELTGKGLSLIEFASPFAECDPSCSYNRFPTGAMETVRNYGAIPVFSWASQSTPVPDDLSEPNFQLSKVIAGNFDSYIREFAEAAKAWGHPFFLRFNWEMNGNWFPWSEGVNGNQAGEYVAAWRHVHDIFTQVGATNASWVWCPYAYPGPHSPAMRSFYPGSRYVDWTCLDGYNWATNQVNSQPWRSFDQIFSSGYREITKLAPKKPMMLGEIGSGGWGRAKATWIGKMFESLRVKYRRIRALVWFDQFDRGVPWPIELSPLSISAFARGLRQPGFKANRFWAIANSPIKPPS